VSFRIVDIDHFMIRVADLDAGVETFKSLGFTVPPVRRPMDMRRLEGRAGADGPAGPPKKLTMLNRHILFQPYPGRDDAANFLELMGILDQLATPPPVTQMMSFLLDTEGPKAVVALADDIDRAREEMVADGLTTSEVLRLEGTGWDVPETGQFLEVKGAVATPVFGQTPFLVCPCAHGIVESMRHEPWTQHENSARYLAGATGVTEDIHEHTRLMAERVFGGVEPEWESDDVAVIRPRDLFLRIVTPAGFEQLYPGLDFSSERILPAYCSATVAVESLDRVRNTLSTNGVEHVDVPGGVAVPRHEAHNTIIEFVPS
jgi:hypothetical protein